MSWIQRHNLRHYVRNSVGVLPVFGMAATLVSVMKRELKQEGAAAAESLFSARWGEHPIAPAVAPS